MSNDEHIVLQFWAMRLNMDSIDVDLALQEQKINPFDHSTYTIEQAKQACKAYALKYTTTTGPITYLE